MKEFTQDGMFNELSKVTRAINRKKYESMDLPRYNLGGGSCPDGLYWDEALQQCVDVTNLKEVSVTPVSRHVATYEEANPFQDFFAKKKADYIRKAGNFGKLTDLESNFPEAQIKKIRDEYDYLKNNYVAKKLGHNYNDREKWIDKLSASEREVLQNSEFASKLRPSLWAKTKAGLIGLGNTLLPGQPLAYDVKGLSPKEEAEYKNNKLAALDATSFVDLPGAVISNALSNSREYASNPGIFSGEIVNDAGELGAGILNPLLPLEIGTGVSLAPDLIELGLKGAQGAFKAGRKLSRGLTVDDVPLELPGSPNNSSVVNTNDNLDNMSYQITDEGPDPTEALTHARRKYHNNSGFITPEESKLIAKHGVGLRTDYIDPALRDKADDLANRFIEIGQNPVLTTDSQYMQDLVEFGNRVTRIGQNEGAVTIDEYIKTRPDLMQISETQEMLRDKYGDEWYNRAYTNDAKLNRYTTDPRFNPYGNQQFLRYLQENSNRINKSQDILPEEDVNFLNALNERNRITEDLYSILGHARSNEPPLWSQTINENPRLNALLTDTTLFGSPEYRTLTPERRELIDDFRSFNSQYVRNNLANGIGSEFIDLRRGNRVPEWNWNVPENTYREPVQAFEDAIKELYNVEDGSKYAKDLEENLTKMQNKRLVPDIIPYSQVDQVPQYAIDDPTLLSTNDLKEIDEKINFIRTALTNPNLKNKKVIKSLEGQLEDLYSNKWLRTDYHSTMEEAGFKIPEEYKDMSMITQNGIKYLFDNKGQLLGNITGVSKDNPYIGSTGLMPYLHGTNELGKQSQMGKTLYRSVHHGLNNAHGIPLKTRGSFADTELIENGLPIKRKRAANMWESGVRRGWFENIGGNSYKVIKEDGGTMDFFDDYESELPQKKQKYGGNISNLQKFLR